MTSYQTIPDNRWYNIIRVYENSGDADAAVSQYYNQGCFLVMELESIDWLAPYRKALMPALRKMVRERLDAIEEDERAYSQLNYCSEYLTCEE